MTEPKDKNVLKDWAMTIMVSCLWVITACNTARINRLSRRIRELTTNSTEDNHGA